MINKELLQDLLEEKKKLEEHYNEFRAKCLDFDNRLCDCLGVERGSVVKHEDIIKELLKDD